MAAPAAAPAAVAAGGGGEAAAGGGAAGGGGQGLSQVPLQTMPAGGGSRPNQPVDTGGGALLAFLLLGGLGLLLMLIITLTFPIFLIAGIVGSDEATKKKEQETCSGRQCTITGSIPPLAVPFKEIYVDAGKVFGVNPYLLMAVHEDESQYGTGEGAGIKNGLNYAGCCAGPMQFSITGGASNALGGSGGTWAGYRTAYSEAKMARPPSYPNRYEPHPNVYDSFDAIYAAAKYFKGLGVGPVLDERTLQALRSYKGVPPASEPYAQHDYQRAKELERLGQQQQFSGPLPNGPRGVIDDRSGDALPPEDAPEEVKDIYRAANEINDKPYLKLHYPTHIANPTYDCSSSTSHALWGGGLFGDVPWTSSMFGGYGEPGVGRWVTAWYLPGPDATGHVYLVVAGLRFDTSDWSGDNRIPAGDGPRWTANLGPVTAMAAQGFLPRHPPGL